MKFQRGLTLIELILMIVIVGVALAGTVSVIANATRRSADPVVQKQALAIAESLMEELNLMPYTFCSLDDPAWSSAKSTSDCSSGMALTLPTTNAIENRSTISRGTYAHIFDYVNSSYFTLSGPIKDVSGNYSFPADYSAKVTVTADTLNGLATSGNVLRLSVTVTGPLDTTVRLDSFRTRHWGNM